MRTTKPISSPAKAGAKFRGDVIPGLHSLRSLTLGYHLSPLCGCCRSLLMLTHH